MLEGLKKIGLLVTKSKTIKKKKSLTLTHVLTEADYKQQNAELMTSIIQLPTAG